MPHRKIESNGHDEGDTTYVYSRAEDRSFWAWTAALADKYKILVWAAGFLLVGAGFGFRTPQQVFGEINAEIDTLKMHERSAETERHGLEIKIDTNRDILERKIDVLLKLRCYEVIEKKMDQQALLAGLNCAKILRDD